MKSRTMRAAVMLLAAVLVLCGALPAYAAQSVFMPSQSYAEGEYYQKLLDVELTGDPRVDTVSIALSQVGYMEGGRDGQYSGYSRVCNNFSEYGRAMGRGGAIWCTSFVWWCVRQAGLDASVFPDTIWPRLLTVNCPYVGYTSDASLQPGDILFVENTGDDTPDHLSLVVSVNDSEIIGVEGNCGNRVCLMSYNRDVGARPDGMGDILYIGYLNYEKDPSIPDASSMLRYALVTADAPLYNHHTGGEWQGVAPAGQICSLLEVRGDGAWVQIEIGDLAYWTDPSCLFIGDMNSVLEELVGMSRPSQEEQTTSPLPEATAAPEAIGTEATEAATTASTSSSLYQTHGTDNCVIFENEPHSEPPGNSGVEGVILPLALGAAGLIILVLVIRLMRRSDR